MLAPGIPADLARFAIGFDQRDRGQRTFAHDHGMDELDGHVVGMRLPLG